MESDRWRRDLDRRDLIAAAPAPTGAPFLGVDAAEEEAELRGVEEAAGVAGLELGGGVGWLVTSSTVTM
jgi:hypothetical protein